MGLLDIVESRKMRSATPQWLHFNHFRIMALKVRCVLPSHFPKAAGAEAALATEEEANQKLKDPIAKRFKVATILFKVPLSHLMYKVTSKVT